MFYFDWTYMVLVLPCVIFAMWASSRVNSTFKKYSKQRSSRNLTGEAAARAVLNANGLNHVRIERVSGNLTDHYDPKANVIRLSDSVYSNTSTAAIGVAAHEAGHAVQYAVNYIPVKIRTAILPATQLGSKLAMPLILAGLLLTYLGQNFLILAYLGILAFGLSTVFQLVTLPTEFNASNRALRAIAGLHILDDSEMVGARRTLQAAALTYVAALAVSLAQLLRLLMMVNRRR
ncbi:MAG: zinc metallopeptidase [Eubacteriales bacterium]